MGATRLDHVNITTRVCEATKDFFVDIVGLAVGFRPPFAFGGYWLYAGDFAVVHLNDALTYGSNESHEKRGGAALDHVSFRMKGFQATRETLERGKLAHSIRVVPSTGDMQIFVDDPNGVTCELTFDAVEVTDAQRAEFTAVMGATLR
jgi:catechol 2,3-dioxygenase-like lactoylglutathione lyase family enzyme